MVAHVCPPGGSLHFLAYPPPKACRWHSLGTWVPRSLGVAYSASSPSSAGIRMQPYPRAPSHIWPGHLHGAGCLSARAMDTGFHTVVLHVRFCLSFANPLFHASDGPAVLGSGVSPSWRHFRPGPLASLLGYGSCRYPYFPGWGS